MADEHNCPTCTELRAFLRRLPLAALSAEMQIEARRLAWGGSRTGAATGDASSVHCDREGPVPVAAPVYEGKGATK